MNGNNGFNISFPLHQEIRGMYNFIGERHDPYSETSKIPEYLKSARNMIEKLYNNNGNKKKRYDSQAFEITVELIKVVEEFYENGKDGYNSKKNLERLKSAIKEIYNKVNGNNNIETFFRNAKKHEHTGFPKNYDEIYEKIDYIIKNKRDKYPIFILLDVKNLKGVNEICGYTILAHGDEYLRIVGESLRKYFKKGDLFAMFGGDEILGMLKQPEISEEFKRGLEERLDRINEEINTKFITYLKEKNLYKYYKLKGEFPLGIHYKIVDLNKENIRSVGDLRRIMFEKYS